MFGRIGQRLRDAVLNLLGDAVVRVARVEDLMATGKSEAEAQTSMKDDWARGIRRWSPIVHAAPVRSEGAAVLERRRKLRRETVTVRE